MQTSTSRSPASGLCFAAHRWQDVRSVKTFGDITNTRPLRSHPWKCLSSLMGTIVALVQQSLQRIAQERRTRPGPYSPLPAAADARTGHPGSFNGSQRPPTRRRIPEASASGPTRDRAAWANVASRIRRFGPLNSRAQVFDLSPPRSARPPFHAPELNATPGWVAAAGRLISLSIKVDERRYIPSSRHNEVSLKTGIYLYWFECQLSPPHFRPALSPSGIAGTTCAY